MVEFISSRLQIIDITWIIEPMLMALAWGILCRIKQTFRRSIIQTIILLVIFIFSRIGLFLLLGQLNNTFIIGWNYLIGIITVIYIWKFSQYENKTKILLWITLYTAELSASSLGGECSLLMSTYNMNGFAIGSVRCIIYALAPLTAVYLRKHSFDEFPVVPNSGMFFVLTLCVCVQILIGVESMFLGASTQVLLIFIVVYTCMVLTSLTSIQALYTMCREQRDLTELQGEKQRYLAEKEITRIAENSLEDLRIIRHDIKNQYSYMQILLQEERYSEMKDYFEKMQDNLPKQLNIIDCGNRTINTVLNMEFSKLRSKDILFEHQLVVPPALPFKAGDICSILSNLLDNAAEECSRIKKNCSDNREIKIRLEIYPHQSYLFIRCMNTTDRIELDRNGSGLRTTKSDTNLHGFGTRIVSKLAEKYNGCADYSLSEGMFVAQVMLDITGGGQS